jgi:UDP-N-acetylenolpyruvoylglucosamine reductase
VNDRKGTAADVRALLDRARDEVAKRFGVELVPEIELIGDWGSAG